MSRITIGIGICLAILLGGCNREGGSQQARQSEKGQLKPVVAIVPLVDKTMNDVPWSLSEELTSTIHHRLSQTDKLYLASIEKIRAASKKLGTAQNPFGPDIHWTKKVFYQDEFVVFMELIEHDEVPSANTKSIALESASAQLNMTVRVRVIDLRGEEPQIVLQEMIQDSHFIPKQFTKSNFYQVPWGKESYNISPLGLAHAQLSKEIATRLEDYILLAKAK